MQDAYPSHHYGCTATMPQDKRVNYYMAKIQVTFGKNHNYYFVIKEIKYESMSLVFFYVINKLDWPIYYLKGIQYK